MATCSQKKISAIFRIIFLTIIVSEFPTTFAIDLGDVLGEVLDKVQDFLWNICERRISSIDSNEIKYHVYTAENPTIPSVYDGNFTAINVNLSRQTKFIIHGWSENTSKQWLKNFTQAYYANGYDYNVIVVDWSAYANSSYLTSICYVSYVGEAIANYITEVGFDLDDVHVIGHSLGGQVSGYVGQTLDKTQGRKLHRITGLDAAGPMFCHPKLLNTTRRLSAGDAQFVDAIHTNGGENGCETDYGTVDFRPNCGSFQPGCENFEQEGARNRAFCSHYRSYKYYTESIYDNCFSSLQCPNCTLFSNKLCQENHVIKMGEFCPTNATGDYVLETNSEYPHC